VSALDRILEASDVLAVLGRDVPVRLMNISGSGCLVHSEIRIPEGTTGTLRLTCQGLDYTDDVRVVRCQAPVAGDSWYRIGVQFLWNTHPGTRALRRVISGLPPDATRIQFLFQPPPPGHDDD
jgi:hypothetical protein